MIGSVSRSTNSHPASDSGRTPPARLGAPERSSTQQRRQLVQTDHWTEIADDRVAGSWTTDVHGAPLELSGTHEITTTKDGCRYIVTAEVRVRVRFVGGQAESLIRQQLAGLVSGEQKFTAAWLAGDEP